jgi:protein-disulfide isomerase
VTGRHELLEYGDFECPYCRNAYPELKELRRRLGDSLAFEFRHFPIEQKHPHAFQAAEAAEAARAQGRFWDMHDLLFENQRHLEREDLVGYARRLGLDVERFEQELDDHVHADRVRADHDAGAAAGVAGTPALFIDGQRYEGFYDAETLAEELR